MRPHWPRTLLSQNILLLVGAVLVSQLAAVIVFLAFIQAPRMKETAALVGVQIATLQRLLALVPEAERSRYVRRLDGQLVPPADDGAGLRHQLLRRYEGRLFLREVQARLPAGCAVRWQAGDTPRLLVQMRIGDQAYWIALPVDRQDRYPGGLMAILVSLALSAVATLLGYLVHRRINRPLRQLVAAADRLGNGELPEPVATHGPHEITVVARAFNRMVARLAEIDAARAMMLAGISHDIRTPLTKLRLALAMPDTTGARAAQAERYIDDIDAVLQQFIDFARGGDGEAFVPGDLNALVEQLAADFAGLGQPFALTLDALPPLSFRPVSMLRLLLNLMQNAALHGKEGLAVRTCAGGGHVDVFVSDRGPGIAPDLLPLITQPFQRGRQGDDSGTGLGLAIARRLAERHGGRLEVSLPAGGGFQAHVRLPLHGPPTTPWESR
jgi:two-component system osmolarity sensor histidine kinase EnvZ